MSDLAQSVRLLKQRLMYGLENCENDGAANMGGFGFEMRLRSQNCDRRLVNNRNQ